MKLILQPLIKFIAFGGSLEVQWWEYHAVVGTLKHYLMQKNVFELFALAGDEDTKTWVRALEPKHECLCHHLCPSYLDEFLRPNCYFWGSSDFCKLTKFHTLPTSVHG